MLTRIKITVFLLIVTILFSVMQLYHTSCRLSFLQGDEGMTALMAYSMYSRGEYLRWHYDYGWAGDFHISFLSSLLFLLTGADTFSIRLTMILISYSFMLVTFCLLLRFYTFRAAAFFSLLYVFSPPYFIHLQLFHHRMVLEFLLRAVTILFLCSYLQTKNKIWLFFCGFSAGFSAYSDTPNFMFFPGIILSLYFLRNKDFLKDLFLFSSASLCGFFPYFFTSSTETFSFSIPALIDRYRHFFVSGTDVSLIQKFSQSMRDFTASFECSSAGTLFYMNLTISAIFTGIYILFKKKDPVSIVMLSFFFIYSLFYIFFFAEKGGGKYLLPLYQVIITLSSIGFSEISQNRKFSFPALFLILLIYFPAVERLRVRPVAPEHDDYNYRKVIEFLKKEQIGYFYTMPFIRHPVCFESGFTLLGNSKGIEGDHKFYWIDQEMEKASEFAVILPASVGYPERFLKKMDEIFESRLKQLQPEGYLKHYCCRMVIYTGLKHTPAQLFSEKSLMDVLRESGS